MVLESQGLFVIGNYDVVDVGSFADKAAGLGVFGSALMKVGTDSVAQALGFADVDDFPIRIFVQVHPWGSREAANFGL